MCSITGGFYLDGTYLVGLGYRKIHLVIVFSAFCGKRVIVQLMSGSFQHLVDGILIDMSQISAQLVTEERMINRVVGELLIPKCKSDEQPGVGSEHLIFVGIMMQCHHALVPADLQIRRNGASHSLLSRLPGSWILEPPCPGRRNYLGAICFGKNALRGLQEAVFLKPNAPKSAFSKRLGSIVRV